MAALTAVVVLRSNAEPRPNTGIPPNGDGVVLVVDVVTPNTGIPPNGDGVVLVVDVVTVCVVLMLMAGCNWKRGVVVTTGPAFGWDGGDFAIAAAPAFGWDGCTLKRGVVVSIGPANGGNFAIAVPAFGWIRNGCCPIAIAGGLEVDAVPAFGWGGGIARGLIKADPIIRGNGFVED